jgi:hypothetical protein
LLSPARFATVRVRPAYVTEDVGDLLGSVEHALADLA